MSFLEVDELVIPHPVMFGWRQLIIIDVYLGLAFFVIVVIELL